MRKEEFFEVLGELDDDIVTGARPHMKENTNSKVRKPAWVKWGAIAAVLCILAAALNVPNSTPTVPDDGEIQSGSTVDYPAMIMVDGHIYKDSGEVIAVSDSTGRSGEIVSSCDSVPTENNQSNFGTGYSYQYGVNDTIYVQLEDGWRVFVLYPTEETTDTNYVSEQEQMRLEPEYAPD